MPVRGLLPPSNRGRRLWSTTNHRCRTVAASPLPFVLSKILDASPDRTEGSVAMDMGGSQNLLIQVQYLVIPLRLIQARRSYRHYEVGQDAPPMGCGLKKDVSLHRTIGNRPVDISLDRTKQGVSAEMGQRKGTPRAAARVEDPPDCATGHKPVVWSKAGPNTLWMS